MKQNITNAIQLEGFLLQLIGKSIELNWRKLLNKNITIPKSDIKLTTTLNGFDTKLCIEYSKTTDSKQDLIIFNIKLLTYQSKSIATFELTFKNKDYHESTFGIQNKTLVTSDFLSFLNLHKNEILEQLFYQHI